MPKTAIVPPGTATPIAPYSPGTLADGVLYVSGTLPLDAGASVLGRLTANVLRRFVDPAPFALPPMPG